MIITIKGTTFTYKVGTLTTWPITVTCGTGATSSNNITYIEKNEAYSTTITIADGYELGAAGITVTMGGTDITSTAVSGLTISIASVTGSVVIRVPTVNTSTGEEDGGSGGQDNPSVDITTPVGLDKVLLSNYRSETGVTLDSTAYGTLAKDTHMTFFDIPINPSAVYYISWGVRAWFLRSDKTPIDTINFYNASNVG